MLSASNLNITLKPAPEGYLGAFFVSSSGCLKVCPVSFSPPLIVFVERFTWGQYLSPVMQIENNVSLFWSKFLSHFWHSCLTSVFKLQKQKVAQQNLLEETLWLQFLFEMYIHIQVPYINQIPLLQRWSLDTCGLVTSNYMVYSRLLFSHRWLYKIHDMQFWWLLGLSSMFFVIIPRP